MQTSYQIAIFMLVALVAATPNCLPVSTVSLEAPYIIIVLSTIIITGTPKAINTITNINYITIAVTNLVGNDILLSFNLNASSPSPVGNPLPIVLHNNSFI